MNMHKPVEVSFADHGLRLDSSDDTEVICAELINKEVEILVLAGNTFNIEAAERIGLELAKQPSLREAHFKDLFTSRGREIVPDAMRHLLNGINVSGAQLELLDLSDNAIGPVGAPAVIEFLQSSAAEKLERLYLNNCGLGPEGSSSIAATIPHLRHLREFICGRNRLENKGATSMSRALSELTTIEKLALNQNGIHVEGIKHLVNALMANIDSLTEFDLSDNTIKLQGAKELSKVISRAKKLKSVRLDDVLLENEGFKEICDSFAKSPSLSSLREVSFEGNELTGNEIVDLVKSTFLPGCSESLTLDLLDNEFEPSTVQQLEALTPMIKILVDEVDDSSEDSECSDQRQVSASIEDEDEGDDSDEETEDGREDGEISDDDSDERENGNDSDGYVNIGCSESDIREASRDFIDAFRSRPLNEELLNSALNQLTSIGDSSVKEGHGEYKAVQILSEELGLIKCEDTRKKKPLSRDAIVYLGKHMNELPDNFRSFLEVVVKNNDELSCAKLLFDKLQI